MPSDDLKFICLSDYKCKSFSTSYILVKCHFCAYAQANIIEYLKLIILSFRSVIEMSVIKKIALLMNGSNEIEKLKDLYKL